MENNEPKASQEASAHKAEDNQDVKPSNSTNQQIAIFEEWAKTLNPEDVIEASKKLQDYGIHPVFKTFIRTLRFNANDINPDFFSVKEEKEGVKVYGMTITETKPHPMTDEERKRLLDLYKNKYVTVRFPVGTNDVYNLPSRHSKAKSP